MWFLAFTFCHAFWYRFRGTFSTDFRVPPGQLFCIFLSRSHGGVRRYPLFCWTALQLRFRYPKFSKNGRPKAFKRCQEGVHDTLGASNAQPKTCAFINVLTSNFIIHAHLRYPACGSNVNHTTTDFSKAIQWWLLAQYYQVLSNATQSSCNGRATTKSMPFSRWCLSFSDISCDSRIRVAWMNIVRVYSRLKEYYFDVRSLLLQ